MDRAEKKRLVRAAQVRAAMDGSRVTYGEIAAAAEISLASFPGRRLLFGLLKEVTMEEVRCGRPMLCAVAVTARGMEPGEGFYTLARTLDLLKDGDVDQDVWRRQLAAVHATPWPQDAS